MRLTIVAVLLIGAWALVAIAEDAHSNDVRVQDFEALFAGKEQSAYKIPEFISVGNTSLNNWLNAGNLANFMKISKTKALSVPVVLNLVFIGFMGNGNQKFDIREEHLRPWFEHIEHHFEHTFVTPEEAHSHEDHDGEIQYKSYTSGEFDVMYQYTFNVIELNPLANEVIEAAIHTYMRPEDPTEETKVHQVEVERFSQVLESLLHSLKLRNDYTLLILNPSKKLPDDHVYGYRSGFSDPEIAILEAMPVFTSKKDCDDAPTPTYESYAEILPRPRVPGAVDFVYMGKESEHWAKQFLSQNKAALGAPTIMHGSAGACKVPPHILLRDNADELDNDFEQGHRIYIPRNNSFVEIAREMALFGGLEQTMYINRLQEGKHTAASCLVNNWVGRGRWAFIDLTAGPFVWGPVVGGEGVHAADSIPCVTADVAAARPPDPDEEFAQKHPRQTVPDLENVKTAEKSMLEIYYQRFCAGYEGRPMPTFCRELKAKLSAINSGDRGLPQPKDIAVVTGGDHEDSDLALHPVDDFLSKLGGVLDQTIHTLVTPSTVTWPTYYRERVIFHFYLISNHNSYAPTKTEAFQYDQFKISMGRFRLPHQDYSFTFQRIHFEQDPALAMAYTTSLRTGRFSTLTPDGVFKTATQMYLDSSALQYELRTMNFHEEAPDESTSRMSSRHIPIFFFSLDFEYPVFIDRRFQAKALADMVIVVQSNERKWESHFQCNGQGVVRDLRNPLAAAISATGRLLGGVLNTHLTYSVPHKRTIQNWLWSTGSTPFAYATTSHHVNGFNADTAHRNYIVSSLRSSVESVNRAIEALEAVKTRSSTFPASALAKNTSLVDLYQSVSAQRDKITELAGRLDYSSACDLLDKMMTDSRKFSRLANEVADTTESYRCAESMEEPSSWFWLWVVLGVNVLCGIVFNVASRAKPKTRIN